MKEPNLEVLVRASGGRVRRQAYVSDEVFAQESHKIFSKTWQFVAHESEIPASGDYVTRRLGSDPVIVVRTHDGTVRVLHNSCRHRGAQICAADKGHTSHFRCGYHGWTYGTGGELRGVPEIKALYGANFDKSRLGLVPARTETFCGLIFATWDVDGPGLQTALGEMGWWLETVFGKWPMEVAGAPIRMLAQHNWKSGAENWSGDTYHAPTTHRSVFDEAVINDPTISLKYLADTGYCGLPDAARQRTAVSQIVSPAGGHTLFMERLPLRFDAPVFPGYEPHVWGEAFEKLSPEQLDVAAARQVALANIFPNFSFLETAVTNDGARDPADKLGDAPVTILNIRVWLPISATQTEIVNWVLVPRSASPEWKARSQVAFTRTLGPGGMLETDDFQNWTGITQMNSGPVARQLENDFSACLDSAPVTDLPWPGEVYLGAFTDVTFRTLFNKWDALMSVAEHAADDDVRYEPRGGQHDRV